MFVLSPLPGVTGVGGGGVWVGRGVGAQGEIERAKGGRERDKEGGR